MISVIFIGILKKQLGWFPMGTTYRLWARLTIASIVAGVASWYASGLIAGEGDDAGELFCNREIVCGKELHHVLMVDCIPGIEHLKTEGTFYASYADKDVLSNNWFSFIIFESYKYLC